MVGDWSVLIGVPASVHGLGAHTLGFPRKTRSLTVFAHFSFLISPEFWAWESKCASGNWFSTAPATPCPRAEALRTPCSHQQMLVSFGPIWLQKTAGGARSTSLQRRGRHFHHHFQSITRIFQQAVSTRRSVHTLHFCAVVLGAVQTKQIDV